MFRWNNIARFSEALLSRWAIKRVCKFLLKKKLGNFIVGDIDLDQLDVKLGPCTIQLSDLALNVDYINSKLDATSVFVKEGSIGSLVVKVPWKVQNCQIEIKDLEFVLTSRSNSSSSEDCSISTANEANKEEECVAEETNNSDHEKAHGDKKSIPLDVHQGVKTIAKMVKWLLTSFNIKIQNLIVAFDSSAEKVGKISEQSRALVLRMNEIEYGTHVSESDPTSESSSNEDSFLGMTSLTNFVNFSGAAVDILQMEPSSSASSVSILTGKAGGFSGNIKLSIPWKNGSLDMQRLEADVSIDPVVLKLQPSTIISLLYLWKFLRRFNVSKKCNMPHVSKGSSALSDSSSQYHSFTRGSSVALSGGGPLLCSFTSQEAPIDAFLPGAHYIPNWVPSSGSPEHERDDGEPDYAASVDQFFECLDGMWSSQSALYHSGLLNWTCSVFNTISAASNLASGSVCIPEIPQPCEMNLKASVGGIAIVLSVHDEREGVHYLMANCKDLVLAFQICSEKTNFQATLRHFRIDEYYEDKDGTDCQAPDSDGNSQDKAPPVQFLQTEVLSVMPEWDFSPCPDAEEMISGLPEVNVIRVPLLEFSDDSSCLVNMSSSTMVGVQESSVSFTVKLAPFILWVISSPINVLVELMKKVCNSPEVGNTSGILSSEALHQSWNLQYKENVIMGGTSKHVMAKSPIKNVQGSVSLSSARLIVCFPFQCRDSSLGSFIGLDFSCGLNDGAGLDLYPKSAVSSLKGLSEPSIKVHLRFGDLNAYLVTSSCRGSDNHAFSAKRFLFVNTNKKGQCSSIGISWQEDPVNGPSVAKKAKCRATSNDSKRTQTKVIGKDCEFATARIATGTEEGNVCLLQEMIMSSALSFHACFPLIQIELDSCEYRHLFYLLTEGMNDFMCGAGDVGIVGNEGNMEDLVDSYHGGEPSQTTIILECDVLSICANLECAEVGSCLQRELPGSWASLSLNVEKFELLSASNVGGSNGAKFLSISHGEGELWGSLDESVEANNFLLVSCSNSAMKRGDGEGTNALSSFSGGSTIVNFCESLSFKNYTSVSIRCATIIAPGGRLDWMNAVCSFFSFSNERESPVECSLQEDCAEDSFSLSLVDSALSYEPKMPVRNPEIFGSEHTHEELVACIIAMSVLDVSKHAMGSSIANDYELGLLDVGLLVSTLSGSTVRRDYGVDALRKNGYVKVAGEAIIGLVIRVNCSEEPLWELECSDFQVKLNTCQDTTGAIVHLASQLQQLFAPDIEESLAHLQTRWDMVQQAHGASEDTANANSSNLYMNCNSFPSGSSYDHTLKKDVGIMDEIVQDAFQLSRDQTPHDSYRIPRVKEELVLAASESNMRSDRLTDAYPTVPKFTESYCISRWLPLDAFPKDGYFSNDNSYYKLKRSVQGKTGSSKNSGWYEDCPWNIVENHVSNADNVDEIHEDYMIVSPIFVSRAESCMPRGRVILKNFNISWKMYNGLDWNLPTSSRDTTYSMEWVLSGMNIQYDIFAEGEMYVSKLNLSVRDFHLYDRSRDAPWMMVLGYYHTKDHPRESCAEALKVELETVRPKPQIPLEEYRLCLSLLPLRLNLDQSQLDFLVKFFAFQSPSSDLLLDAYNDSSKSIGLPTGNTHLGEPNVVAEALLPFFQKCDINPVVVRVDYNPRHIDLAALRGGNYTELLNLVPWKGIELLLKDVHAVGLYGWGNVCETVLGEWLEDISHKQIHKLLKGLAPIRSLVAVSTGAAKLVSLPVKSYRKDQRLLKGMQRGAVAFVRSISLEAVGLGVHLAAGAHDILLQTECILTSGSSSVPRNINKRSVRSNQPRNARQGMLQAYDSLSDGLGKTASALVGNPLKTYQRGGGAGSALASAIRAAPAAAIVPASALARAMHCTLLGVRNSLSPERKEESVEKYSGPSRS